jgi:UDP-N-acetylglucosamine:LPS N-acetylglucosamine transferase
MTRKITLITDFRCLWLMYRFFKKEKPDIVHSHTPKAGLIAMLAARFAGVKIRIHTIAGLRFMTSKGFGRKVLVTMEKLTASAATHVWPNSYSLLNYIKKNKLVKPPVVATILRKRIPMNAMEIPIEQMNTYFQVASNEVAVRSW